MHKKFMYHYFRLLKRNCNVSWTLQFHAFFKLLGLGDDYLVIFEINMFYCTEYLLLSFILYTGYTIVCQLCNTISLIASAIIPFWSYIKMMHVNVSHKICFVDNNSLMIFSVYEQWFIVVLGRYSSVVLPNNVQTNGRKN